MAKTIKELEESACLYWPTHLSDEVAEISSLPFLLKTQDQFLSILKSSDKRPDSWLYTLRESTLSPNLFLKHLMVLTDIGGERLQRFAKDFHLIFPNNQMEFSWNAETYVHRFSSGKKRWTNKKLFVEKSILLKEVEQITDPMKDVVMLLLWGGNIIDTSAIPQEITERCIIGNLLGKPAEIEQFVRQRYIVVSRITSGSTANDLGHACEQYVRNYLTQNLSSNYECLGHQITGISHNEKNLTTFDLIVRHINNNIYFAIEISFQVTTNSVIERKSSLAQSRKNLLSQNGHKIIYIIDGSGNFSRTSALNTILRYSDLVVNFSDKGLDELIQFIVQEGESSHD